MPQAVPNRLDALQWVQSHWAKQAVHDLRSPLQIAIGYVRLTLEDRDRTLTAPQKRYLTESLAALAKLTEMLQDLPTVSAVGELDLEEADFGMLIEDALKHARRQLCNGTVKLKATSFSEMRVLCDRIKLSQAVNDFLAAAVVFTGDGGEILVAAFEDAGKIVLQIDAMRSAVASSAPLEISLPSLMWRLHGGSTFLTTQTEQKCQVTAELPSVR